MNDNQLEKLHGLLSDFDVVMLMTMGGPAGCHARPMAVARLDENTDLWFFASLDSTTVREIEADSHVQIHGQGKCSTYVVLVGHATVVEDRAMIREAWKPTFKIWFPGGADDPNVVLLHVKGEHAEYWDNTGATALVMGPTLEIKEGEQHANVELPAG
jgi:general stress protein 26